MGSEQSERIGGAVFLGVPFFDTCVSALDNYGRLQLIVSLQSQLPSFLTNPMVEFLCLCAGLGLLYASHRKQLQRIANQHRARVLDASGNERDINPESPKWLVPVIVVLLTVIVMTPALGLNYALKYKGQPPKMQQLPPPPPPYAFYVPKPPATAPHTKAAVQTGPISQGPGSALSVGQQGGITAGTINMQPPQRHLTEAEKSAIASAVQGKPCKINRIGYIINVEDAQNYAAELRDAFGSGGCNVPTYLVPMVNTSGQMPPGIEVQYHVEGTHNQGDRVYVPPNTIQGFVVAALDSAKLGCRVGGDSSIPDGDVYLLIGARQE
jgi:hypothetical protein